jgi:sodium transport system ATP-binding protein
VVRDAEGARKSLGFCSTGTALYPRLTARETLGFFARINGYPDARVGGRVDELIVRFGLAAYADAWVEKLSSGMKQKVSLARTLAHDPPVVIFDEPTANLDVLNAVEVRETMKSLRGEGKAIVFSTHLMNEAEHLCDRIAIVDRGRILACDTLEGLRLATGRHYLEDVFLSYVQAPA